MFEIDLDTESVWLDDAWLTRDDLARKIKSMIDSGDYQVARPSQALESLTKALASARLLALRITPELSDALNAAAQQAGRPPGALAREALTAFLSGGAVAQPPQPQLAQAVPQLAGVAAIQLTTPVAPAVTTEPVSAEEAAAAVTLVPKRKDGADPLKDAEKAWFGK